MRVERRDFLVEIGTEELPPKALPELERAFADGIRSRLIEARLGFAALDSFATPRRLAVRVRRLQARQPEQAVNRRGPPLHAAFDAAGLPTRAALAFAHSCGVGLDACGREHDAKGTEFLAFTGVRAGASAVSLLPAVVQAALDALPIPRRMRWGSSEAQFVRPVHWLVLLYGRDVIPATLLDTAAGAVSLGHRFMCSRPIRIRSAATYPRSLLTRGKVVADFAARRERIRVQVTAAAAQLGGQALIGDALLDEVTALVEWPVAIAGRFEGRFLALPREVLLSTLQDHQRYFAVQDAGAALLPWFVTVSNIDSPRPELVRAGNERVVRPRLADAAFFWDQDRRQPLHAWYRGLDAVTFQAQLGSLGDKTRRVQHIAAVIAPAAGADPARTARAAELCKCDLLSAMVGEFPELQGTMGRYYASADGEHEEVAEAIREHYLPRGAGDALPATAAGSALALADKLDTLAGIFALGQKPSGTKDPFGLRRAAIGLLRIVLERRIEVDLPDLIEIAVRQQPVAEVASRAAEVAREIDGYIIERLRAQYLEDAAESGITTEMVEAVRGVTPASILDFDARLRALRDFVARPECQSLAAANKRIANILRKSAAVPGSAVETALLHEPAELQLYEAMRGLIVPLDAIVAARDYRAALDALARLRPQVDTFFDRVLVNAPDAALRANRLSLLAQLRALFTRIADFSQLPG
jgi:glycyl-tRNA synthetase beta chain